jgi:hypothetical protein
LCGIIKQGKERKQMTMEKQEIELDLWRYDFSALKLILHIQELGQKEKRPLNNKEKYALLEGAFKLDRAIEELINLKKIIK